MSRFVLTPLLTLSAVLFVGCSDDNVTQPATEGLETSRGASVHRPFSDYVETQGTFCFPDDGGGCIDFEPPMKNFLGWMDPTANFNALFEYLGNADVWLLDESGGTISLGTEITGMVTERPMADGRALIHINVHARNILTWMTDVEDFYLDPLVFGYRVGEVLDGAPPALGDFRLTVQFIVPEQQAPIPDLFQLFLLPEPGQELLFVSVNMSATGILHEGSGYPEGTLGRVRVVQVYPPLPDSDYSTGWSVEHINIKPIDQP